MAEANATIFKRSNGRTFGYCLIAGSLAVLYGMVVGQTSGFLAMPRYASWSDCDNMP